MLADKHKMTLCKLMVHLWRRWVVVTGLFGALALTPVSAETAWTAAIRPDPITRQSRCLLISDTQTTSDGYDYTPVYLLFDGVSLRVVTESKLDPAFADLQLVVDEEASMRSENITHHQMVLVFDQNIPNLVKQFQAGQQATVFLRFWPTWPVTQSFPIQFSLVGFSKAHDSFKQGCQPTN